MVIENKYKEGRFNRNKQFFREYHDDVLATNRVGSDPNIQGNITMFIAGTNIDGKEYLIPLYNPDTGEVEGTPYQVERDGEVRTLYKPTTEALDRARQYIQSGQLVGYSTPDEAEADRRIFYPQIIE
jgi:hypothetical protein|tara:strand:- start:704 stop:1084 length:381 start_codon:yes stop_codon:yes gene_type:complete